MTIDWVSVQAPSWSRAKWVEGARDESLPAIDPYLVWADVTEFVDLEPSSTERRLPVILELEEPAAVFAQRCRDAKWDWIRIPSVYRCAPGWLKQATFCTATITHQAFGKLGGELKGYVRRLALGSPIISETDDESDTQRIRFDAQDHPCLECKAGTESRGPLPVLIGIIDAGVAFAHERVRESVRGQVASRVEYFWNQNADSRRAGRVRGLGYGYELSRGDISKTLQEATHGSQVDEDELYREADYPTAWRRVLHGTHIMDLAAGENPKDVTGDSPRMICVELPKQMVRDTSGLSLAVHALDAIRYVLDRAACISRGLRSSDRQALCPVVVNLSFGNIAGPHDGSSMLETAMDELIGLGQSAADGCNLQVVLPAGNNHLSRCHARIELAANAEEILNWRILPDDATPSFLEIWISAGDADNTLAVEVTPPGGSGSGWVRENEVRAGKLGEHAVCTVVFLERVATGKGRMILVAVAPTCTTSPTRNVAPAGTWRVRLKNDAHRKKETPPEGNCVTVDAWIQRDDTPIGFPRRGRQSRFDDAQYIRFDPQGRLEEEDRGPSIIKRAGTLNAIATGDGTIVIGGYRKSDGKHAPYSASGRTRSEARGGPDALEMSERSGVRRGVLAAGNRSGSRVAMWGTSVAAPRVTRLTAKLMRNGPSPDRTTVFALAEESEQAALRAPHKGLAPKPPEKRGGGGRLGFRGSIED